MDQQTDRHRAIVLNLFILLGILLLGGPLAAAAQDDLVAVPPLQGKTRHPALLTGLQQIVIDDLNALTRHRVMTREAIRTLLQKAGKGPRSTLYVRDIPKFQALTRAKFVLLNTVKEQQGRVSWEAKLVNTVTGTVENTWQFAGWLNQLMQVKNQVISALRPDLGLDNEGVGTRPGVDRVNGHLSAFMAFAQGLEAFDNQAYAEATTRFHEALQRDTTFIYATRQLTRVRARVKQDIASPRERGLVALADGQPKQAAALLHQSLSRNGNDVEGLLALSDIETGGKRYKTARKYAMQAREIDGEHPQPWITLGKIAKATGKEGEALQLFRKARELAPDHPAAPRYLAELYEKQGDMDKAKQAYVDAGTRFGRALQLEEAQRAFAKARKLAPQDRELLLKEGHLLMRAGQLQQARRSYEQAQKLTPGNAEIDYQLGELSQHSENPKAASAHWQKALDLNADHVAANVRMGQLYLQDKQYARAIRHLQWARRIQPENVEAGKALAQAYAASGQDDLALQESRRLVHVSADDPELHTAYGDMLLKQGDMAQARLQYEHAARLNPDAAAAHKRLGLIRKQQGQVAKAKFAFALAKRLAPDIELPEIAEADVHEGLRQFVSSFPPVHRADDVAKVALIDTQAFMPQTSWFEQIVNTVRDFVRIRRVNLQAVQQEFVQTYEQAYELLSPSHIQHVFASAPYRSITSQDLDNTNYLLRLCQSLEVDALVLYRVVEQKQSLGNVRFKITTLFFTKSGASRWFNETSIDYPRRRVEMFNWPFIMSMILLGICITIYFCIYFIRDFGYLKVVIHQDSKTNKATFSIILSKKERKDLTNMKRQLQRRMKNKLDKFKYEQTANYTRKYKKFTVFHEAIFKNIHVGDYHVFLYGIIPDGRGGQMGNYQMTQTVRIEKDDYHEVVFDLRRKTSEVEVQVFCGANVAIGAEVSLKGAGESRYIKDEIGTSFHLPVGQHTFLINYEGQLFTEHVEIANLEKHYYMMIDLSAVPMTAGR